MNFIDEQTQLPTFRTVYPFLQEIPDEIYFRLRGQFKIRFTINQKAVKVNKGCSNGQVNKHTKHYYPN